MSISVFLSTVTDEFGAYRVKLEGDLTRHDVAVKVQERFKDLGGDTLDKLDGYVAHCDAVVHLVGEMCGAAADLVSRKRSSPNIPISRGACRLSAARSRTARRFPIPSGRLGSRSIIKSRS
jgi:hypothetical protein